jgi:hypothetical protein
MTLNNLNLKLFAYTYFTEYKSIITITIDYILTLCEVKPACNEIPRNLMFSFSDRFRFNIGT